MDDILPKRKIVRLQNFDYSEKRYYFVTICSKDKQCVFGQIVGAACTPPETSPEPRISLSPLGKIAAENMEQIPNHNMEAIIEKYVIMPNHVHAIISIGCHPQTATGGVYAAPTMLPKIINNYKASVTRQWGQPVWQRSFYEHIIRGPSDYEEIWQYIENNPLKWTLTPYNV